MKDAQLTKFPKPRSDAGSVMKLESQCRNINALHRPCVDPDVAPATTDYVASALWAKVVFYCVVTKGVRRNFLERAGDEAETRLRCVSDSSRRLNPCICGDAN